MADPVRALVHHDETINRSIAVFIFALFLLVAILMCWSVYEQVKMITLATDVALKAPDVDHAAVLGYSRALNTAVVKTCCVFLGYLLMYLGGLYILRTSRQAFGVEIEGKGLKGSLNTASPGLVMASLGTALVLCALFHEPKLDYAPGSTVPAPTSPYPSVPSTEYEQPPK